MFTNWFKDRLGVYQKGYSGRRVTNLWLAIADFINESRPAVPCPGLLPFPCAYRSFSFTCSSDLEDGTLLIKLLQQLTGKTVAKYSTNPRNEWEKKENTTKAFKFMEEEGLQLVSIGECSS